MLGHDVTVYEAHEQPGGMLRYALPEYRLPKSVLDQEIDLIRRTGVKFVCNTRVGYDLTLNELDNQYDGVFLSVGTWKETAVDMPGVELEGVMHALSFLEAVGKGEPVNLGRRVIVIGGGNAAIDSARTALRMGSSVTVVYRRERKDMPAIAEETAAAEAEGAHFVFLAAPHRIVGEQGRLKGIEVVKTRLGEFDASGRRKPVSTEEIQGFKCDTVILAIGERVDPDFARAAVLNATKTGTIEVDRFTLQTSRTKFYAGGDLISGASNVSNAMGYGKKAVRNMDRLLMGRNRMPELLREFEYSQSPPDEPSLSRRHHSGCLPASERVKKFIEVEVGLTADDAHEEACRCLRCDIRETSVR